LLLTCLGTGVVWLATSQGKGSGTDSGTSGAAAADVPFRNVWRFDKGPAGPEFRIIEGFWDPDPRRKGGMIAGSITAILPMAIPKRPVALTMKFTGAPLRSFSQATAAWTDGRQSMPRKYWHRRIDWDQGPVVLRCVFVDRWMFCYGGSELHAAHEYEAPYPASQIVFRLVNVNVEEIELRGLKPEEIPADFEDPLRTLTAKQLRPGLANPEVFPEGK
jgi:hypothetical protein